MPPDEVDPAASAKVPTPDTVTVMLVGGQSALSA
jgi:hypothetical protein